MNTLASARIMTLFVAVAVLPFCIAGCGTSQSPRIYTLNTMPLPAHDDDLREEDPGVIVGIGPIEIPDYLDQAQIITRTSANQLSIAEFDLWGGSLREDVARVLVENIRPLLRPAGVSVLFWKSYVPCTFKVPVSIVRLDATRGGSVTLKARWAVVGKDLQKFEVLRETVLTKPVKGNESSDVVTAMSEALGALSLDIASDVKRASVTLKTKEGEDKRP
jgi:uncharacterized protein